MTIDLRSDTVTKPSAGMRQAMAEAEVGDDVLDGDPTTRKLEQRVAGLLGKEDALFFPSGSQANQAAIWFHARPGTELLLEADAHHVHHELAGAAALGGVQIRPVATPDGLLTAEALRAALRPGYNYLARPGMISIENTHNVAGGKVMPVAVAVAIGALAREKGLPLHLDGARLWNAATALGEPLSMLAEPAATVMVSFSKGLGCPVGSALACAASARADLWEIRKRLGGGMRQTGILAAAALYALDHNLARIGADHENARRLARALEGHPGLRPLAPETNIVMIDLVRDRETADEAVAKLEARGVRVVPMGRKRLRAVLHLDVSPQQVEQAARIIREVLA